MKYQPFALLAAACLAMTACQPPAPSCDLTAADLDSLRVTHEAATKPMVENPTNVDWNLFAEMHYSENAIMMPPNGGIVEGREAIAAMFKSWPVTKVSVADVETAGSGNMAYIRGTYDLTMKVNDSTEVNDKGKWLEVWERSNGQWRCTHDIFNTDMPAE